MLKPDVRYTRNVVHEGNVVKIELNVYDQTFTLLLDSEDFEKIKHVVDRIYVIHNRFPQYPFYQNYPDKSIRKTIGPMINEGKIKKRFYPINGNRFDLRSANWGDGKERVKNKVLLLKNPPGIDRRKYVVGRDGSKKEMAGITNPTEQSYRRLGDDSQSCENQDRSSR